MENGRSISAVLFLNEFLEVPRWMCGHRVHCGIRCGSRMPEVKEEERRPLPSTQRWLPEKANVGERIPKTANLLLLSDKKRPRTGGRNVVHKISEK